MILRVFVNFKYNAEVHTLATILPVTQPSVFVQQLEIQIINVIYCDPGLAFPFHATSSAHEAGGI